MTSARVLVLCAALTQAACHDWAALSRGGAGDAGLADAGPGPDGAASDCPECVETGPHNYVFVTSETYAPGSFGGLGGADALCQTLGEAKFPGRHFVAWLSDSQHDAKDRLVSSGGIPARGWIRPDGRPFTDSVSALLRGVIYYPPRIDEGGTDRVNGSLAVHVATGTGSSGAHTAATANDWSSTSASFTVGNAQSGSLFYWTAGSDTTQDARLYCFGVDFTEPVTLKTPTGRMAFLSHDVFAPSGISAADALCQTDATARGFSGTFIALLSTTQAAASTRVTDGAPWVRVDGVVWMASLDALKGGEALCGLNVEANGSYRDYSPVWTGSATPGVASSVNASCANWTSTSASDKGVSGRAESSGPLAFTDFAYGCDQPDLHVICLQQ